MCFSPLAGTVPAGPSIHRYNQGLVWPFLLLLVYQRLFESHAVNILIMLQFYSHGIFESRHLASKFLSD